MSLWPVYLLLFLLLAAAMVLVVLLRSRDKQTGAEGTAAVTQLPASDWQHQLEQVFDALGYRVERPPSRDASVDLILTEPGGRRVAVRARHGQEQVGVDGIQQVTTGAGIFRCHETMIITAGSFTRQARQMATQTGTHLWGVADVEAAMAQARAQGKPALPAAIPAGAAPPAGALTGPAHRVAAAEQAPRGPVCPHCRAPLQLRSAVGREIWLCSRFPKCNYGVLKE
jgi:hypothetical protein